MYIFLAVDNKSGKVIPGRKTLMRELSLFSEEEDMPKVSPQLQLAILQYLNTGEQTDLQLYSYLFYMLIIKNSVAKIIPTYTFSGVL